MNPCAAMPAKNTLPPPLRRRLVFGDREQIEAIRKIEANLARGERGEEREFMVSVEISFYEVVRVTATCEDEAEEIVNGRLNSYLDEADVEISAQEVKSQTASKREKCKH